MNDDVCGVTIAGTDGIDIVGTGVEAGCSAITGAAGGVVVSTGDFAGGATFPAGCGGLSTFVSCALVPSSCFPDVTSVAGSDALESRLVLDVSAATAELRSAGLSGRDPRSDEARDSDRSLPLFTAFARRSCNREFGRLRD